MITVHIWYPQNTPLEAPIGSLVGGTVYPFVIVPDPEGEVMRWGHAGIEFENVESESGTAYANGYRAFWPGTGADWQHAAPGRIITDRAFDVHEEGSEPSRSIRLATGINEALIYRYWTSLQSQPLDYTNTGFNCCSAVAVSVRDGFPADLSEAPAYPPMTFAGGWLPIGYSNPYALEEWIEDINQRLSHLRRPVAARATVPPVVAHGHQDRS